MIVRNNRTMQWFVVGSVCVCLVRACSAQQGTQVLGWLQHALGGSVAWVLPAHPFSLDALLHAADSTSAAVCAVAVHGIGSVLLLLLEQMLGCSCCVNSVQIAVVNSFCKLAAAVNAFGICTVFLGCWLLPCLQVWRLHSFSTTQLAGCELPGVRHRLHL
jgi:hypothetical protein